MNHPKSPGNGILSEALCGGFPPGRAPQGAEKPRDSPRGSRVVEGAGQGGARAVGSEEALPSLSPGGEQAVRGRRGRAGPWHSSPAVLATAAGGEWRGAVSTKTSPPSFTPSPTPRARGPSRRSLPPASHPDPLVSLSPSVKWKNGPLALAALGEGRKEEHSRSQAVLLPPTGAC